MQLPTIANELPMPIWIALMVLGFILFWPLGVITLVYLIWSGKMLCCFGRNGFGNDDGHKRWDIPHREPRSSGNAAFDEYREATLRRLEEDQRDFNRFVERLRRAKDQEEFDSFMAEQAARRSPQGPSEQT